MVVKCSLSLKKAHGLSVSENRVLRGMYEHKRNPEVTMDWRILHNAPRHDLYSSLNIFSDKIKEND
jgi:hypothetical protein